MLTASITDLSHIARVAFRARRNTYALSAGEAARPSGAAKLLHHFNDFASQHRRPPLANARPVQNSARKLLTPKTGIAALATFGVTLILVGACMSTGHPYVAVDKKALAPSTGSARPQLRPLASPAPGVTPAAAQTAQQINAQRPFDEDPIRPMRPFVFTGDTADRARAQQCLSQAVYYEAAREPLKGQQAVAQVVLNRVRHPAYPKSVCGVVYQGSANPTGCQFTFTCDGALRWRPEPALWDRAQAVARQALAGFVDRDVGSATHYHAAYVAPAWAPSLLKMTQVGQHIFYRWTGAWGEPAAFTGRYAGREAELTQAVLKSGDPPAPAPREVTLAAGGGVVRTYKVVDATAPGGVRGRVQGVLMPTRRQATPEQIQRINDNLAELSVRLEAEKAAKAPANVSQSAQTTSANAPS
jgi:spore germination cell wall hydrolase CwlJ-like protein